MLESLSLGDSFHFDAQTKVVLIDDEAAAKSRSEHETHLNC